MSDSLGSKIDRGGDLASAEGTVICLSCSAACGLDVQYVVLG